MRFVQLTVPGTGPREQLAILDFFVRHHPRIGALVIVADAPGARAIGAAAAASVSVLALRRKHLGYAARLFSSRAAARPAARLIGLGAA